MARKLDEQTQVPLKWVFILLSCSGSALILAMTVGLWVSKMEIKLQAAETQINKSGANEDKFQDYLVSIDQRLSRIEGRLGIPAKR